LVDGHDYAMKSVIKRQRFSLEIMPVGVRWYVAYRPARSFFANTAGRRPVRAIW
jgi:hypothetical protein